MITTTLFLSISLFQSMLLFAEVFIKVLGKKSIVTKLQVFCHFEESMTNKNPHKGRVEVRVTCIIITLAYYFSLHWVVSSYLLTSCVQS